MAEVAARIDALIPNFTFSRLLNQDQAGRRITLYGTVDAQPAVLTIERAPFPVTPAYLSSVTRTLRSLKNLGNNDIYAWFLAASGNGDGRGTQTAQTGSSPAPATETETETEAETDDSFADLKLNLIWPCTEQHVRKYSRQGVRLVTETPAVYRERVRPFMQRKREAGRLAWVYNIIEGTKEAEDVIYRTPYGDEPVEGFLLSPDLNWDRRTREALHLLAIVERRDIWSLRDLRKKHVAWLRRVRAKILEATVGAYPGLEEDQLKLYVHYQPTYYHFHIHVVHVALEAGATQATGKAVGLESIVETLVCMAGDDEAGMETVALSYTLGEASELWTDVFEPLKAQGLQGAGKPLTETTLTEKGI